MLVSGVFVTARVIVIAAGAAIIVELELFVSARKSTARLHLRYQGELIWQNAFRFLQLVLILLIHLLILHILELPLDLWTHMIQLVKNRNA